jgi:hypothetical protein
MGGEFIVTIRLLVAATIFSETVDGHVQYDKRYFLFLLSDQLRRAASVYAMQVGALSPMSSEAYAGSESPSEASAQARKRAMTISIGTSAFIVSWARGSVALLVSLLLGGCYGPVAP